MAKQAFLEAKEWDEIRFRAPEAINQHIRRFAEDNNIHLVDVQAVFEQQEDNLFTDHLHPDNQGYGLIADAFFDVLQHHPQLPVIPADTPIILPGVDRMEETFAYLQIARLTGGYPFNKTISVDEENRQFQQLLEYHLTSGYTDSLAVLLTMEVTTPPAALLKAARESASGTDTLHTLLLYNALMRWQPFNRSLAHEIFTYMGNQEGYDATYGALVQYTVRFSRDINQLNLLAAIRLRQRWLPVADVLLTKVEKQDPTSADMLFNKARLLVLQGDTTRARTYYERYRRTQ